MATKKVGKQEVLPVFPRTRKEKHSITVLAPLYKPGENPPQKSKEEEEEIQSHKKFLRENARYEFLSDIKNRLKSMSPFLKNLGYLQDEIEGEIHHIEALIRCKDDIDILQNRFEKLGKLVAGMQAQLSLCHNAWTNTSLYDPDPNGLYKEHRDEIEDKFFRLPGVKCIVAHEENDILLVQLPLLFSMYSNYQNAAYGYQFPAHSLVQFGTELDAELRKIRPKLKESFAPLGRLHLAYVHVYDGSESHMIDNDNFDTKKVTDVISTAIATTDHPLRISFSSFAIVSKSLQKGTYVYVSGDYKNPPSLDKIEATFDRFFVPKK